MSKALSFVRLDFITVKPYLTLKSLAIMLISPLFIMIATGVDNMAMTVIAVYSMLYVSYPFAICDKNNMDALYPTLCVTRKTVVLGRYLYTLAFDACAGVVGLAFTIISLTVKQKPIVWTETLLMFFALFIAVSILQTVQLPIYFKLGYEKSKVMAYLPIIGFGLVVIAFQKIISKGGVPTSVSNCLAWLEANSLIAALIGIIIWFALIVISCSISCSFYEKRDF